jgi:hypothetical protein
MPGYVNKALMKYQHLKPVIPQHSPYKVAPMQYGARVQRVEINTTQPLTPKEIKHIQDIVVPSCTMRKRLTQHFLPHSVPLQHVKPMAHRQWQMHFTNSSITLPHTQMQAFDTNHAT